MVYVIARAGTVGLAGTRTWVLAMKGCTGASAAFYRPFVVFHHVIPELTQPAESAMAMKISIGMIGVAAIIVGSPAVGESWLGKNEGKKKYH